MKGKSGGVFVIDESRHMPNYNEDEKPFRMPSEGSRFRLLETSFEVKRSIGAIFTAKAVSKPVKLPPVEKKFRLMETRFIVTDRNYKRSGFVAAVVR